MSRAPFHCPIVFSSALVVHLHFPSPQADPASTRIQSRHAPEESTRRPSHERVHSLSGTCTRVCGSSSSSSSGGALDGTDPVTSGMHARQLPGRGDQNEVRRENDGLVGPVRPAGGRGDGPGLRPEPVRHGQRAVLPDVPVQRHDAEHGRRVVHLPVRAVRVPRDRPPRRRRDQQRPGHVSQPDVSRALAEHPLGEPRGHRQRVRVHNAVAHLPADRPASDRPGPVGRGRPGRPDRRHDERARPVWDRRRHRHVRQDIVPDVQPHPVDERVWRRFGRPVHLVLRLGPGRCHLLAHRRVQHRVGLDARVAGTQQGHPRGAEPAIQLGGRRRPGRRPAARRRQQGARPVRHADAGRLERPGSCRRPDGADQRQLRLDRQLLPVLRQHPEPARRPYRHRRVPEHVQPDVQEHHREMGRRVQGEPEQHVRRADARPRPDPALQRHQVRRAGPVQPAEGGRALDAGQHHPGDPQHDLAGHRRDRPPEEQRRLAEQRQLRQLPGPARRHQGLGRCRHRVRRAAAEDHVGEGPVGHGTRRRQRADRRPANAEHAPGAVAGPDNDHGRPGVRRRRRRRPRAGVQRVLPQQPVREDVDAGDEQRRRRRRRPLHGVRVPAGGGADHHVAGPVRRQLQRAPRLPRARLHVVVRQPVHQDVPGRPDLCRQGHAGRRDHAVRPVQVPVRPGRPRRRLPGRLAGHEPVRDGDDRSRHAGRPERPGHVPRRVHGALLVVAGGRVLHHHVRVQGRRHPDRGVHRVPDAQRVDPGAERLAPDRPVDVHLRHRRRHRLPDRRPDRLPPGERPVRADVPGGHCVGGRRPAHRVRPQDQGRLRWHGQALDVDAAATRLSGRDAEQEDERVADGGRRSAEAGQQPGPNAILTTRRRAASASIDRPFSVSNDTWVSRSPQRDAGTCL